MTLGELHVWRADLGAVGDQVLTSLSEAERQRHIRFPRPHDGLLWARSRGVLRALLARYLTIDPRALEFGVDGNGKPRVAVPESSGGISFNLSHSGRLALYVFTHATPVGVDVQVPITRSINVAAIAQRVFGVKEGHRLTKLDAARRAAEFCRAWVRREAAVKCLGTGLGRGSKQDGNCPSCDAPELGLFVTELDLGGRAAAAVAASARPDKILCWDWRASSGRANQMS